MRKIPQKRYDVMSAVKGCGWNYVQFAEAIGVDYKAFSAYLNGRLGVNRANDINDKVKIFLDTHRQSGYYDPVNDNKEATND
jgi:hypothetical protein